MTVLKKRYSIYQKHEQFSNVITFENIFSNDISASVYIV